MNNYKQVSALQHKILGKRLENYLKKNTSEMNSRQRMRLTQHPAVLHHCLRCQRGTGFGPKYCKMCQNH